MKTHKKDDKGYILSESELIVLKALTYSKQSSGELQDKTGYSGKVLREHISQLRRKGIRVVASNTGYWLSKSEEDYQRWRKGYVLRIKARIKSLRAMDGTIDNEELERMLEDDDFEI